jgi:glycerate kinase
VVFAVAQACQAHGIPCVAICGKVNADNATVIASGLYKAMSISEEGMNSFDNARKLVTEKVKEFVGEWVGKKPCSH